jgi:archaellum component FlaF (FlaF/FlaG flagellin family)
MALTSTAVGALLGGIVLISSAIVFAIMWSTYFTSQISVLKGVSDKIVYLTHSRLVISGININGTQLTAVLVNNGSTTIILREPGTFMVVKCIDNLGSVSAVSEHSYDAKNLAIDRASLRPGESANATVDLSFSPALCSGLSIVFVTGDGVRAEYTS